MHPAQLVFVLSLMADLAFQVSVTKGADTLLGTLTCTIAKHERNNDTRPSMLSCQFRATDGGYTETYIGTLRMKEGQHPGQRSTVLMWTVSGKDVALAPGILEQNYVGSEQDDDPGIRQLKGQKNALLSLRPLTSRGEGAEHTVTILDLTLKRTGA